MSRRHPSQSAASPTKPDSGNYLLIIPKKFVLETVLASVALGALMVEMRLVARLAKGTRVK